MTKPTVTDEMVEAAVQAYIHMDIENYCDREAMRAAIEAALNASGLVERIAELETDLALLQAEHRCFQQLHAMNKDITND